MPAFQADSVFTTKWQNQGKIHVVPVDDVIEHNITDGDCICGPEPVEDADGIVYMHPSLDGREVLDAPRGIDG